MANIKAMEAKLKRMEENVERLRIKTYQAHQGKNSNYARKVDEQYDKAQKDYYDFKNAIFLAEKEEDYNQSLREQKQRERENRQASRERWKREQYSPHPSTPIGARGSNFSPDNYHRKYHADDKNVKINMHTDLDTEVIDGYIFTYHAMAQIQSRGVYISLILDTLKNSIGLKTVDSSGISYKYYSKVNDVTVILSEDKKRVVSVYFSSNP